MTTWAHCPASRLAMIFPSPAPPASHHSQLKCHGRQSNDPVRQVSGPCLWICESGGRYATAFASRATASATVGPYMTSSL